MKPVLTPSAEKRLIKAIESGVDYAVVRERFGLSKGQMDNILGRLRRSKSEETSANA
jgi:hypothetical protein